jgi:hypothetical protein
VLVETLASFLELIGVPVAVAGTFCSQRVVRVRRRRSCGLTFAAVMLMCVAYRWFFAGSTRIQG